MSLCVAAIPQHQPVFAVTKQKTTGNTLDCVEQAFLREFRSLLDSYAFGDVGAGAAVAEKVALFAEHRLAAHGHPHGAVVGTSNRRHEAAKGLALRQRFPINA